VYIDIPYWDKTKKQNRHYRDYIGKLGSDGGFIPNKKHLERQGQAAGKETVAEESRIACRNFYGAVRLLESIADKVGLKANLEQVFGVEKAAKLLSLSYFLVIDGESSMYRYEKFSKTHVTPYGKPIASQRVSEIFAGISENEKMGFFRLRAEKCLENEYLAYDTTSISPYSETMTQVKHGHNKDLENLPQINLAAVFGEDSRLPVYYRKMPGNISDVLTIKKLLVDMGFLGLKKISWVMDRGFYSIQNIHSLYRNRHKFVCAGRANAALVRDSIDEQRGAVRSYGNYSPLASTVLPRKAGGNTNSPGKMARRSQGTGGYTSILFMTAQGRSRKKPCLPNV
jgi:hypothetical protein